MAGGGYPYWNGPIQPSHYVSIWDFLIPGPFLYLKWPASFDGQPVGCGSVSSAQWCMLSLQCTLHGTLNPPALSKTNASYFEKEFLHTLLLDENRSWTDMVLDKDGGLRVRGSMSAVWSDWPVVDCTRILVRFCLPLIAHLSSCHKTILITQSRW